MKIIGENLITSDTSQVLVDQYAWAYQEFHQQAQGKLLTIRLKLYKEVSASSGGLNIVLMQVDNDHKPDGISLAQVTISINDLHDGAPGGWVIVNFPDMPMLLEDTDYCIVLKSNAGSSNSYWRRAAGNLYTLGVSGASDDSVSWIVDNNNDMMFEIVYDDGVYHIPVLQDYSWQPTVRGIASDPPM